MSVLLRTAVEDRRGGGGGRTGLAPHKSTDTAAGPGNESPAPPCGWEEVSGLNWGWLALVSGVGWDKKQIKMLSQALNAFALHASWCSIREKNHYTGGFFLLKEKRDDWLT
jgi:hypothetical protein